MTQVFSVVNYLSSNGEEVITADSIMAALGLPRAITNKYLALFSKEGLIARIKRGVYHKNSMIDTITPKNIKHNAHPKDFKTEQEKLTFVTYCAMQTRCLNPNAHNYKNYGGRGITICDEWLNDFTIFVKDVGLRPSKDFVIDRIDNNKGYYKENCRWATIKDSLKNRRKKKVLLLLEYKGESKNDTNLPNL